MLLTNYRPWENIETSPSGRVQGSFCVLFLTICNSEKVPGLTRPLLSWKRTKKKCSWITHIFYRKKYSWFFTFRFLAVLIAANSSSPQSLHKSKSHLKQFNLLLPSFLTWNMKLRPLSTNSRSETYLDHDCLYSSGSTKRCFAGKHWRSNIWWPYSEWFFTKVAHNIDSRHVTQ